MRKKDEETITMKEETGKPRGDNRIGYKKKIPDEGRRKTELKYLEKK